MQVIYYIRLHQWNVLHKKGHIQYFKLNEVAYVTIIHLRLFAI
jgi:hypothetical protein